MMEYKSFMLWILGIVFILGFVTAYVILPEEPIVKNYPVIEKTTETIHHTVPCNTTCPNINCAEQVLKQLDDTDKLRLRIKQQQANAERVYK